MDEACGSHEYRGLLPDDRRTFERHALAVEAALCGPHGELPVRTVDVSAGGVLLAVDAPEVPGTDVAAEIERVFGEAVKVRFPAGSFAARARIVRIERRPDEVGTLYLGCRFALNLHASQLRRLGVDPKDCSCGRLLAEYRTSILPLETDEASRVVVRAGDEATPLCDGRLVGLGGLVLTAQVKEDESDHLMSRLDGRDLAVQVRHDEEDIWSSGARLLALRWTEEPRESVEVSLLAKTPPDADVTARFRPRLPIAG